MKTVRYNTKIHEGERFYFATVYDFGFFFDSLIGFNSESELRDRVEKKYPGIIELEYCLN